MAPGKSLADQLAELEDPTPKGMSINIQDSIIGCIADQFIQILIPRILTVMAIPAMKRLASPQRQMLEGSITRL